MSLNNIRINNHQLAQLYAHTLLQVDPALYKDLPPLEEQTSSVTEPNLAQQSIEASVAEPSLSIVEEPVPHASASARTTEVTHLGGNSKNVLLITKSSAAPFLPDAELEFLTTVLSACRLSIADVAIVNLQRHPQDYQSLVQQFRPKQVLLLGVLPEQLDLPIHFPHFQLQPFDGRTYLSAYSLTQMKDDRDLKGQWWKCLKAMFGV